MWGPVLQGLWWGATLWGEHWVAGWGWGSGGHYGCLHCFVLTFLCYLINICSSFKLFVFYPGPILSQFWGYSPCHFHWGVWNGKTLTWIQIWEGGPPICTNMAIHIVRFCLYSSVRQSINCTLALASQWWTWLKYSPAAPQSIWAIFTSAAWCFYTKKYLACLLNISWKYEASL